MVRSSLVAFSDLWRAYGEGRLDRSLDLVDPECEVIFPDGRRMLRGREGVRQWLDESRREWKTLTITYDDVHEEHPDCVVGVGHVAGSSADGSSHFERPLACVAQFRDGRLIHGRVFEDGDAAVRYAHELRAGSAR